MPPLQEVNVANCLEELAAMAKASEGAEEEEGMALAALRRTRLVRPKLHILGYDLRFRQCNFFKESINQALYIIVSSFKGIIK